MYPRVIIDTKKFRSNVKYLLEQCHKNGMTVMGVSKVYCADQKLIDIMCEEQIDYIADSRILNLIGLTANVPKVLLRLPMHGEVDQIVKHVDISLNSELSTVKLLDTAAGIQNKKHGVIIMIDLGDLREGIFDADEVYRIIEEVLNLNNIVLKGIGTNLTCYGGVIPTEETLNKLVEYKYNIERKFNIELEIITGGNSSNIELMLEGKIPKEINNIRLGESFVLGRETAYGNFIDNTYDDVFTLEVDIIEVKEKPSVPIGLIGMNAFGKVPEFDDQGNIIRAIAAIGKQDVDHTELIPFDTIKLLGSSSDHIILDVSDAHNVYEVGDKVLFKLTYASVLSLFTSKYVVKTYE
jgi:predicted amino acid racemase